MKLKSQEAQDTYKAPEVLKWKIHSFSSKALNNHWEKKMSMKLPESQRRLFVLSSVPCGV